MKTISEEFKIKLFHKVGEVLSNSNFSADEPIPISSVFYNIDTLEIIGVWKNEMSIGLEPKHKYLKHSEYIAVKSSDLDTYLNVGVLITIPPCADCYKTLALKGNIKQIYWITHKHAYHKIIKINKLIQSGIDNIPFEKLSMETDKERDCYEIYKKKIRNIEKWMRNS